MAKTSSTIHWFIAVFLGAIVATTGDHLHVVYGVLYYPHPALFQQAIWVYPLFVGAVLAMLLGCDAARARARGAALAPSLADALLATAAFFVAYAFTAVAADFPTAVLLVLLGTWLARVRRLPRWIVGFGVLAAVCGVASESALSRLGGFYYVNPDFLGTPRWLGGLYLHAALATVRIRPLL